MAMYEKTITRKTVYEGVIIDVELQDVELPDGRTSIREIVLHGPAVALVVRRVTDGRFIFIRQFRKALDRIAFEVVAGNCDPGEEPAESARRELQEETGYRAARLVPLGAIFPTIGYCTERIDLFYAEVSGQGETAFDHDEQIETVAVTRPELEERILSGQIQDAKTLAAWLLFEKKEAAGALSAVNG